jgi:predicted double-glycine peptidase
MLLSAHADFPEATLAALAHTIPWGTTPLNLARAARPLGYRVEVRVHADLEDLRSRLPCIVLINPGVLSGNPPTWYGHFVVVKEVQEQEIVVNDPAPGVGGEDQRWALSQFLKAWEVMDAWLVTVGGPSDGKP